MPLKSRATTDFTSSTFDQMSFKREGLAGLFDRLHTVGSIRATPCIGESKGKKRRDAALEISQLNRPRVTYERFPRCWFLHAGKPWPVKDCPIDVFKSALHNAVTSELAQELLSKSSNLDLVARWYLCCEAVTLRLYGSKEEAMQILQ